MKSLGGLSKEKKKEFGSTDAWRIIIAQESWNGTLSHSICPSGHDVVP